jgi:AcrR family transcriptional regulator
MVRKLDEVDNHILYIARELFLTVGIQNTEMKDIALKAEIGRSTLYRHFSSKEQIAFYIAKDILLELHECLGRSKLTDNQTGYEKLEIELKQFMNTLIGSKDRIRFLDEFDQVFTDSYPEMEEALDYVEFNKQNDSDFLVTKCIQEGIEDGSIRPIQNPEFEADVMINMILGIAQRIIPRSQHYIEEHGAYIEIMEEAVNLLLLSLKA